METLSAKRKPAWIRSRIPSGENFKQVQSQLHAAALHTVCEEAQCPNIAECWGSKTATFMILGDTCTRNCLFCAVKSARQGVAVDSSEPKNIAGAVKKLGLRYVVLTSVDRDDLADFGAGHYAECIREIKKLDNVRAEALVPDFNNAIECLKQVTDARPDVLGHNIEVVESLQRKARDARASYSRSLSVLKNIKELHPKIFTKSSLMLGLGEKQEEVLRAMDDLLEAQVDFLTIGQYLQPAKKNLPVMEFIAPEKFKEYREIALEKGFSMVASGPLVRSSYRAAEFFHLR